MKSFTEQISRYGHSNGESTERKDEQSWGKYRCTHKFLIYDQLCQLAWLGFEIFNRHS